MEPILKAAKRKGADFLTIREMEDAGSNELQNQYGLLERPQMLRRREALFDPTKKDLNNLLYGAAGATIAAPDLVEALRQ